MKLNELLEAIDPKDFRTRKDWTEDPRVKDRGSYEKERSQKLGGGGTIVTLYNDAVQNAKAGDFKKLDDLIVASIIASIGFDRALIDRSVSLEDALNRDIGVGVVRGKNFGTHQERKTIDGYIRNRGSLDNVYVSQRDELDQNGKSTGRKFSITARQYWTSPYRSGVTTPMLQSKMWAHTEHGRISDVANYLNSTSANVSVNRINEILRIMTQIEKFEKQDKFKKGKETSREIAVASNIEKDRLKTLTNKPTVPTQAKEPEEV